MVDDSTSTNKFVTAADKTKWDDAATAAASALQSGDNVSELTNDAGYITKSVNDLTNYTTTTDMNTALAGKQATIDATHKVDADLIDDSTSTNKFVTASEKTAWDNAATAAASALQSGDNVSELTNDAGYITKSVNDLTNYTTTTDMNTALAGKQATIDANNTLSGAYLTAGTVAETALDSATQTKLNNAAAAKYVTVHTTWGNDSATTSANVLTTTAPASGS